jgi:hypothetical protein
MDPSPEQRNVQLSVGRGQWLDDFVRQYVHPVVRELGFKRKGKTWNRSVGEVIHVVHIQGGRFGPGFSGRIGLFVPLIHRYVRGESVPSFISEYLCQLTSSLGAQWGTGLRFEQLDPNSPTHRRVYMDEPTVDVQDVLQAVLDGVAHLDQIRSLEDVRRVLLEPSGQRRLHAGGPSGPHDICLAVLAAHAGELQHAKELLSLAIEKVPDRARASLGPEYRMIAERLGVAL